MGKRRAALDEAADTQEIGVDGQVVVLLAIAAGLLLSMWKEKVLPDKYFKDSGHVQVLLKVAKPEQSDPFARTAWLYQQLGPLASPGWVSNLTYALAVAVVLVCVPYHRLRWFTVLDVLAVVFCLMTAAIYLAQYSKESVVLLIVLFVVASSRGAMAVAGHVAVMAAYAWWVRPYWALTAVAYLLLVLALPRVPSLRRLAPLIVLGYLALAVASSVAIHADLTSFRALVNDYRTFSSDAQSMIVELVPGHGPIISAVNVALDLVGLLVPFPLLIHRNTVYLAFGFVISAMWLATLVLAERSVRRGLLARDHRLTRSTALLVAVVCVQAIFEPDYGSYLKHLTPVLPLFLVVLDRTRLVRRGGAGPRPAAGQAAPGAGKSG